MIVQESAEAAAVGQGREHVPDLSASPMQDWKWQGRCCWQQDNDRVLPRTRQTTGQSSSSQGVAS